MPIFLFLVSHSTSFIGCFRYNACKNTALRSTAAIDITLAGTQQVHPCMLRCAILGAHGLYTLYRKAELALLASCSQLPAPGSQLSALSSQLPAPGSRLSALVSRLSALVSRLSAPSSQPPAPI